MRMRKLLAALLIVLSAALLPQRAAAQAYPSRPVTMIVPFAAGGSADAVARIVADGMAAPLGQPVIIENDGGASGTIGMGRAVRATPDGYTLCFGSWASHVVNGGVRTLPFDVLDDFAPVALIASNPLIIVARKDLPADDLKALVAWIKANPSKALLGTAGPGSASNLAGVFFEKQTGTQMRHVPYRGLGIAMQDLMAGRLDIIIDLTANALPQVRAGTVRAYAITSDTRLATAPDVPTAGEAGVPGLYVSVWQGLWAPKATPKPVIDRIDAAVVAALANPQVQRRLGDLGQAIFPPAQQTPAALRAYHAAEIAKWWPLIKAANIKAE
jgi:tripartite-type tricarboxylate transporter receptor subunit TctC